MQELVRLGAHEENFRQEASFEATQEIWFPNGRVGHRFEPVLRGNAEKSPCAQRQAARGSRAIDETHVFVDGAQMVGQIIEKGDSERARWKNSDRAWPNNPHLV
jgi:hypothetical protein